VENFEKIGRNPFTRFHRFSSVPGENAVMRAEKIAELAA
jgi:hypothetical protein